MNWVRRLRGWWLDFIDACHEPWPDIDSEWDSVFPQGDGQDSRPPPDFADRIPDGFHPCDTQPTQPGALDTLPGKLP